MDAVKAPGNGSNGSAQTPSVLFPFFKGVRRHRCSCCRGAGLLVCVGGAKAAWATSPGRVWWRFALALAHRATARRTSQAARRAAASGLRRWPIYDNAVFLPLSQKVPVPFASALRQSMRCYQNRQWKSLFSEIRTQCVCPEP